MPDELQKLLDERFAQLPPEVQRAIVSPEFNSALQQIGQKRGLHLDAVEALKTEALLVMSGLSNPDTFTDELQKTLHIDATAAENVAGDVAELILTPIRESMKSSTETAAAPISAPAAVSATPVPPAPPKPPVTSVMPSIPVSNLPEKAPEIHPAERVLSQPTVSIQKTVDIGMPQPAPGAAKQEAKKYAADPYREPIE